MVPFDDDDEVPSPLLPHGVMAAHTAQRTNAADGGCTKTVPHPLCSGLPVHVIRGIFFFSCELCAYVLIKARVKVFIREKKLSLGKNDTETPQTKARTRRTQRAFSFEKKGRDARVRAQRRRQREHMPRATRSRGKLTGGSGGGGDKEEEEDEKRRKETEKKNVGKRGDDFGDESDSDDAPPEEVARADAERDTREEQMTKKRAIEMQQISKEREKEKRLEKEKERQEAAAKRKREKEERAMEKRKEEEPEDDDEAEEFEDPDAFTLDEDIVDAVAANENELKEKYLRDFYDTKSQRKKRKKQLKRERMREEAMGRQSAKFTTRDGFDVVIRSKVDELAEMKTNPKALDFARQRLDAKHRRDERMLCDTRTGKIKNQFAVR